MSIDLKEPKTMKDLKPIQVIIKENADESLHSRQQLIINRLETIKNYELSPNSPKNYSFSKLKSLPSLLSISTQKKTSFVNYNDQCKSSFNHNTLSPIAFSNNNSNSMKSIMKFNPFTKRRHKKLSKINYFYNKKMPNWKETNPIKQKIEKEIYKTPIHFTSQIKLLKKQRKEIKLEKYQNCLIEAASNAFSKEAVNQLNQTFTNMRKTNVTVFEKCGNFLKKIEAKEKAIVKDFFRKKTMFNKIFFELSDRKKENLIDLDIKFSSVFKQKKNRK